MVFSGLLFLGIFLPVLLAVYHLSPKWIPLRNYILLAVSLLFYGWGEPKYVFLMMGTILSFYGCGLAIGKAQHPKWKKVWMTVSVVIGIGLLAVFKYADFFVENFNAVTGLGIPLLRLALPVGISFYTFQCLYLFII